ncbi:AhpC-TSA-domain-containing protein [Cystobasidium minutum MCA 4210]|uniref:AhpC-TSA-domain-containing protein n=1 Tax=Cystobasidium minutum MCA 4210 TaxID=1397322 RepID=UPI0034CF1842|eukprot:jgi/Rhomi1/9270/CE9269_1949
MAPQKRNADDETTSERPASELRRSTRGGGHKAPEPKPASTKATKAAAAPSSKSKKAKTEEAKKEDEKNAQEDGADGKEEATANGSSSADKKADEIVADAEKDAKKEGVQVPEENKDAAKEKAGKRIEVGETLPEGITLKNEKDEDVNISDLTKEKGAVFFVYPKANTPGCTTQACLFRDHYADFAPLGYEVYGLSSDSPKAQSSWKEKNKFQYTFLCDPGQILLTLLGASKGAGKNQRSHYIVEKGGKLVDAKYTVSPKDSVNLALEFIKSQQK